MRGAGTLRTIIGRPIYGKQKQQQEPDLHEAPPKKHKTRKSSGGLAAGQQSLFNFYSVAAPAATAPAASQTPSVSGNAAAATNSSQLVRPRCKSAPLPVSTAAAGSINSEPDASWSASSQGESVDASQPCSAGQRRQTSPEVYSQQQLQQQQCQDAQQQQQQLEQQQEPPQSPMSGPLLVNTRLVGRQHQSAGWPPAAGSELLLVREASNPVDPCAILVRSLDSCGIRRTHGHLPAAVACHLAPLIDRGEVQIQVTLPQTAQSAAGTAAAATTAAAAAGQRAVSEPPSTSRRFSTPAHCTDLTTAPGIDDSEPPASDAAADPVDPPAQQQQLTLQLHVTLLQQAEAPAAALSAVDRAASAGLESLQPGRSSGATLAAAFEHIMNETRQHDFHLLSVQEQSVLQHMQALPAAAKALLLRLLLRKRTWFQLSTLAYADVPQPETAARRLAAVGLLQWDSDPRADLDSLLQELPVLVLKQVLASLLPKGHPAVQAAAAAAAAAGGGSAAPNKAAVISSIQANACRARLQAAIAAAAGPCVAVTPAAATTFARLQLLYFASPGHDLSMFVAVERGAVSYPSYTIQRTRPVFSSRQQVLDYEAALALAARVDTALEVGDNDDAWQLLQPALTALQAGVHKGIAWDEACAPVPNPLPRQRSAPPTVPAAAQARTAAVVAAAAGAGAAAVQVAPKAGDVCINSDQQSVQRSPTQALRHVPSAPAALGAQQQLKTATAAAAAAGATANFAQPLPTEDVGADLSPRQQCGDTADVQQPAVLRISAVEQHLDSSRPDDHADHGDAAAYTGLQASYGAGAAAAAAAEGPDSPPAGDGSGAVLEVFDLTQASSSDVSWDMEGTDDERDTAAAAAAGAALPGTPAVDPQQAQLVPQQQQELQEPSAVDALQQCIQSVQPSYDQQLLPSAMETAATAAAASSSPSKDTPNAAACTVDPQSADPPLFFARFCAGWVHASLGTVGVSLLEKQKRYVDAVELLRLLLGGNACVGRRGDWWTRLAINLEHLGRIEDALEAVEAALADAWVRGGDLLGLQRRYLRLGKPPRRWKRPHWAQSVSWEPLEVVITARPLNNNTGLKSRFYAPDNSLVTVEQLALQHYASQEAGGWQGLHCEGGVWAALFTLLLWDVIFMGVPDVFRSPFQTCPLDLDTDAFYPARRTHLDTQLTRIADGQAGSILTAVWSANAGVMARGVNWQRFSQQQLLEICDCVGGLGLAAVLRLMAEDHAGATGGLPDLLLWRPSDRCAKCVEVKGPRDRLSHQQRFWLAHMANNTMEVEVLKVKEPQGNKRK